MCKVAGRPWPVIDESDDVIDFMVMEAVAIRVSREDEKVQKEQEREAFKHDKEGLDRLRSIAG